MEHGFTFTPALFVTCDMVEEIERAYDMLLEGWQVVMPLALPLVSETLDGFKISLVFHGN